MKTLRHTCAAIILTLALACSVLAGEIDCPGVVALPPQTQTEAMTATVTSNITSTIILMIIDWIP